MRKFFFFRFYISTKLELRPNNTTTIALKFRFHCLFIVCWQSNFRYKWNKWTCLYFPSASIWMNWFSSNEKCVNTSKFSLFFSPSFDSNGKLSIYSNCIGFCFPCVGCWQMSWHRFPWELTSSKWISNTTMQEFSFTLLCSPSASCVLL